MDIEKLEKLSCLKLKDEDKINIEKSLQGIFKMMSDLERINVVSTEKKEQLPTVFRVETERVDKMSKKDNVEGLHIEDGYFLAPKVIKK